MVKRAVPITWVLILSLLLTLGLPLAIASAMVRETRTVGVDVEDWVKYGNFDAEYASSDPEAQRTPSVIVEHDNTAWIRNKVVNISGSLVTFESLVHFENGTEYESLEEVDINTGTSSSEIKALFKFVSADLGEGDSIYSAAGFDAFKITETIFHEYIGGISRKTNHLSSSETLPQGISVYVDYHWDKETGILCEYLGVGNLIQENYITSWEQSYNVIDTNIEWVEQEDTSTSTPGGYPPSIVVVVMIIVFVPVVFLVWRQTRRKSRRRR